MIGERWQEVIEWLEVVGREMDPREGKTLKKEENMKMTMKKGRGPLA